MNLRRRAIGIGVAVVAAAMMFAGCSAPAAEPASAEEEGTNTPVTYPVPDGCPTAEDFSRAFVSDPTFARQLNAALLDAVLSDPLPAGGCGYLVNNGGNATSSGSTYERVIVFWFNMDSPNRLSTAELTEWATSIGATAGADGTSDFDLPDSLSGYTNGIVSLVDGVTSFIFDQDSDVIPEFTQGASGRIDFYLSENLADAVTAATDAGVTTADPTTALASGLPSVSYVAFDATDPEGYTVNIALSGKLWPWATDVADSAPGEEQATSHSRVSGSVTNTTAARNATSPKVNLFALYPMGSAACMNGGVASVVGADWQDSSYCTISLGSVSPVELSPDATQVYKAYISDLSFGPFPEGGSAVGELSQPLAVYAALDPITMLTTTDWTSSKGCLTNLSTTSVWAVVADGWPDLICQP